MMDNWINLNIILNGKKQDLHYINKQINESSTYPAELFKKRENIIEEIEKLEYKVSKMQDFYRNVSTNHINKRIYFWLDDARELTANEFISSFDTVVICTSVNKAKYFVKKYLDKNYTYIYFDLDHDLGEYAKDGGDAIKLIDWLIENYHDKNMNFKFHFHSMNPVGVQNMRNAVEKYWEVV